MARATNSADVDLRKRALRRELLTRRRALSLEVTRAVGEKITEHVVETSAFERASRIALYAASGGEPDLRTLFDAGRRADKVVLLPVCGDDRRLRFHVADDWSGLSPGRFGLLEPSARSESVALDEIDLVLVPCVAVDERGVRLGRGGGWYDRSFAGLGGDGAPCRVACVHAFQCVKRVPAASHDGVVDAVASEGGIHWLER